MSRFLAWLCAAALTAPVVAFALSVQAPSFTELVDEATVIARGRVTSVESFSTLSANGTPVIKTRVTWQLEKSLKGAESASLSLEFLGGRADGQTLAIPGMPTFRPGDYDLVFVGTSTKVACPLLAGGHGRYRVLAQESGEPVIARQNGQLLTSLQEVRAPLESVAPAAAAPAAPLTLATFEAAIADRLALTLPTEAVAR